MTPEESITLILENATEEQLRPTVEKAILEKLLRDSTMEQLEFLIEKAVSACPNLFIVARGLRAALQDDWEKSEVADLLMEGVEFP